MIFAGIDPDLRNTAVALVDHEGVLQEAMLCLTTTNEIALRLQHTAEFVRFMLQDHPVACAIEWQQYRRGDASRIDPNDIVNLNGFAGAAAGMAATKCAWIYLPSPSDWKGTVPKHIKQNRIVEALGVEKVTEVFRRSRIPVPKNLGAFTREFTGLASDALDACGLALWAAEKHRLENLHPSAQ